MKSITLISMASLASASILWDGRFNGVSLADISKWDFSNPVGPYQWYIHGDGPITEYLDLSPSNKNTADTGSSTGLKVTIDNTAYWHGQNMRRTELIPQTTAPINKGKVFYHFSIMRKGVNPPSTDREHQICFFESHFTELKSGSLGSAGSSDTKLKWFVGGQSQWETEWEAGVWHNVAYAIDFDAGTVGFYHSVGGANLVKVGDKPVAASTSSNGADWHLGVLELPRNGVADSNEDFFFSGVYVEDGNITLSVSGPGGKFSTQFLNPPSTLENKPSDAMILVRTLTM